jgi:hypothetical protein
MIFIFLHHLERRGKLNCDLLTPFSLAYYSSKFCANFSGPHGYGLWAINSSFLNHAGCPSEVVCLLSCAALDRA